MDKRGRRHMYQDNGSLFRMHFINRQEILSDIWTLQRSDLVI